MYIHIYTYIAHIYIFVYICFIKNKSNLSVEAIFRKHTFISEEPSPITKFYCSFSLNTVTAASNLTNFHEKALTSAKGLNQSCFSSVLFIFREHDYKGK